MAGMMPTGLGDDALDLACPHCGCPVDGLAVELAGWHDAWRHELRGPHGEWVRSASAQVIPGAGYSKRQLEAKLAQMISRAHGPDRIVHLVNAGSALHVDDWLAAGSHLFKAADAADAEMKPGSRSQAAKSYRALAEAIEEHYTEKTSLGDRMASANRPAAQEAPHWLGGGAEGWNGRDVRIFDQNTDPSVAASMGWGGEFAMSDDTAKVVRGVLDATGPSEPTPELAVSAHELIHGVQVPLVTARSKSGRTERDDEILDVMDRLSLGGSMSDLMSARYTLDRLNIYRNPHDAEITEAELDDLARRGFVIKLTPDQTYNGKAAYGLTQLAYATRASGATDTSQHQKAYQRYRVSRAEEGFTELGTNYHMPQWMDAAGISGKPTTTMDVVNPQAFAAKFSKQALYDNQQTLQDLEREAGNVPGGPGTMTAYTALSNAKWAMFAPGSPDTEVIATSLATAAAALQPSYPALSARIYGYMHTLNVDPADVRNLTMREYAEQIASHPARISSGGWGHYKWETNAAQAWVNGVARFEGLDPDYPGGPGVARAVELSDEVNREGAAGKFPAMARQIMRAMGVPADAQITATGPLVERLAKAIENDWPVDATESPQAVMIAAQELINQWKEQS